MDDQSVDRIASPHFLIDTNDEFKRARIELFKESILDNPEAYKVVLSSIGKVAAENNVKLVAKEGTTDKPETDEAKDTIIDGNVVAWIREFLGYKYDSDVDYDDETNRSLSMDTEYQAKLREFRGNENPDTTEKLRDEVRRMRLGHFVGEVILWQNLNNEQSKDLPSAS